ncbi:DUF6375 family protein [Maridesulfovibrio sp.]|uniref:DUF6375 family protein n=1 Tax=unclassified Maridesulfovibrio TaxID=2794999 RepID=UPI003AFFC80F
MKIWHESVSEHSMRLVMIGSFKEVRDADKAKDIIDKFTGYALENDDKLDANTDRYDDALLDLMRNTNTHLIGPSEIEQFMYGVDVGTEGKKIIIQTDESEVSAFMKILINEGARVEVYSGHDYPEVIEEETTE